MEHKLRNEQLPDVLLAQRKAQSCSQWLEYKSGFFNKLPCNCSSFFLNVILIIAAHKKRSQKYVVRKNSLGFHKRIGYQCHKTKCMHRALYTYRNCLKKS